MFILTYYGCWGENILGMKRLSISRKNCPQGLTFLDVATLDTEETMYRGGNHKSVVVRAVSLQMIVPARIDGVVTDSVHCAVVWLLLQWWAGLNRTSANISRRVGSNEAIPIHIDCVPLYRSHTHTDAKHRHIFRAMFPFDPDPYFVPTVYMSLHFQAYPPQYSMHTKLPITQSICICII